MSVNELAAELNAGYQCPPDAGPAWQQALREGMDMSLIDRNLGKSEWERLLQHDHALELARTLQAGVRLTGA